MTALFHDLISQSADRTPSATALQHRKAHCNYEQLQRACAEFAGALIALNLARHDRVAVYLPKQLETVVALFGTTRSGCVCVPVNPVLKPHQVRHILRDCNVRVLITSADRLTALRTDLMECPDLQHVIVTAEVTGESTTVTANSFAIHSWTEALAGSSRRNAHRVIDVDIATILYTSGSTGTPKGVVLSHRNLVTGAESVASYLENQPDDRILAVLPLSFDYGLSQLTTAFHVGASVVLLDQLFARDVVAAVASEGITGLAAVPPLWTQLAELSWPSEATASLRYITNSGGAMPIATLKKLRSHLPSTKVFLMYGLTEAFRSTFLPPTDIDHRPGSIGKAIPNAEVIVVRPDGNECEVDEPGELVHRGSLVALGYWNAPELTQMRFRPSPSRNSALSIPEIAVWSGDTVKKDADGYLYFVGRRDEMIKTSGYRVSPTEVEEVLLQSALIAEAVAFGVAHPALGQAIVVLAVARDPNGAEDSRTMLDICREKLPAFMVPSHFEWRKTLPRNANGKYDRTTLAQELSNLFTSVP